MMYNSSTFSTFSVYQCRTLCRAFFSCDGFHLSLHAFSECRSAAQQNWCSHRRCCTQRFRSHDAVLFACLESRCTKGHSVLWVSYRIRAKGDLGRHKSGIETHQTQTTNPTARSTSPRFHQLIGPTPLHLVISIRHKTCAG